MIGDQGAGNLLYIVRLRNLAKEVPFRTLSVKWIEDAIPPGLVVELTKVTAVRIRDHRAIAPRKRCRKKTVNCCALARSGSANELKVLCFVAGRHRYSGKSDDPFPCGAPAGR